MGSKRQKMIEADGVLEFTRNGFAFKTLNSKEPGLDYKNFWGLFVSSWEPYTLAWIQDYSNSDKSFLDIGAWVGPTSLWASKFFKSVHSFEPDPIAFRYLEENSYLNADTIYPYNCAVTSSGESANMFSRSGLGSSMTSMYTGDVLECTVDGLSLKKAIALDDFSLIKIDIEGGERLIIDSLVQEMSSKPTNLIFSFHYGFYANPQEDFDYIVDCLTQVYSTFLSENGTQIDLKNVHRGFSTVLCLP